MLEILKFLPFAALITGYAIFGHYPPERSLRPWSAVGSAAYVEVINNSKVNLAISVEAPEVDSVVRFLGLAEGCKSVRLRLPYVDTKIILHAGDMRLPMVISNPGEYYVEIGVTDDKLACQFDTKVVAYVLESVDPVKWRASPYYRQDEDLTVPTYVILAGDETVCVIFETLVEVPRVQDKFTCKTKWRNRRM